MNVLACIIPKFDYDIDNIDDDDNNDNDDDEENDAKVHRWFGRRELAAGRALRIANTQLLPPPILIIIIVDDTANTFLLP